MNSFATIFLFLVFVAYVKAFVFFNFGNPVLREDLVKLNADDIWVEAPVNSASYPTFSKVGDANNTDGETLTAFCKCVVEHNSLPWVLPESQEVYSPAIGYTYGTKKESYREQRFPSAEFIINFCKDLQMHGSMFYVTRTRY